MSEERPVRATRIPKSDPNAGPEQPWSPVISGIFSIDVASLHAELEQKLAEKDPRTASLLVDALNDVQRRVHDASKLKNHTRAVYDRYKTDHERWVDEKKAAALLALEEEKKADKQTARITIDRIEAAARSAWPKEFEERERKLREFQAACHTIEELYEAWRSRASTLKDLKDLLIVTSPTAGAYRARSRDD